MVVLLVMLVAYPRLVIVLGILAAPVLLIWLVRKYSTRHRPPAVGELAQQFENIRLMSGPQFEVYMADLFRAMGHGATVLGGSGDQGVDILLVTGDQKIAVQCKNYARPVGNSPVQEVFAGARHHGCSEAWVVAPAGYTQGARTLAASVGVLLHDASAIQRWIEQAGGVTPPSGGEPSPESEESPPVNGASPPPVPSRNPPNSRSDQDREQYDMFLNSYLSFVESLENYRDLRDLGQVPPGSDAEKQWRITLRMVNGAIRNALLEMDKLERSNSVFASDGRTQRRAEITATHERIKREIGA